MPSYGRISRAHALSWHRLLSNDVQRTRQCSNVFDCSICSTIPIIAARIIVGIQETWVTFAETKRQTLPVQKQIAMQVPR
jgi:hypothetical protein